MDIRNRIPALAGAFAFAVGIGGLLGWAFDIMLLKSILPQFPTFRPNAAVGIALLGGALILLGGTPQKIQQKIGRVLAMAAAAIGFVTLCTYIFGWDSGFDRILFSDKISPEGTLPAGRIPPPAAIAFLVIGVAIQFINAKRRRIYLVGQWLAILVLFLSLLIILEFLYGSQSLTRVPVFSTIALNAAIAFFSVSIGALFAYGPHGVTRIFFEEHSGGLLVRRILPLMVFTPILVGWIRLWAEQKGYFIDIFGVALFASLIILALTALLMFTGFSIEKSELQRRTAEGDLSGSLLELGNIKFALDQSAVVAVTDVDGRIIYVNDKFTETSGYSLDEVIGKTHKIVNSGYHPPEFFHELWETISSGRVWRGEIRNRAKNGGIIWLDATIVPCLDEGGKPYKYVAIRFNITRRKLAEEKLIESEERYRYLFENNPLPMLVFDFETLGFLAVNDSLVKSYGYSREEFLSMKITDIRPPEEVPRLIDKLAELRQGSAIAGIWKHIKKDGTIVDVNVNSHKIDFGGRRARLVLINDVTEAIRVRDELERSEIHLRTIIENSPDCIRLTNSQGGLIEMNSSGLTMIGADSFEQVEGPKGVDMIAPEYREAYFDLTRRVFEGESGKLEYEITGFHGIRLWAEMHAAPLRDRSGKIVSVLSITRDITERRRMEQEIKRKAEELRLITDTVPLLITYTGADQIFRFANRAFLEWVGKTVDEVIGSHTRDVIGEDAYRGVRGEIEEALSGKASTLERVVFRERATHSGDVPSFIRVNYVPDFDAEGKVRGFFSFIFNLTETKAAEEELRQSREQLMQAQKLESIGRLAGGIAHDFNNMLTAINGYSELTLRKMKMDDPLRKNIEEIKKAGERSAELTNQLLAFSRRQMLQPRIMDINHVISDTAVMLQRLIGEDIELTVKLDPDVGRVSADPGQFAQVLVNLAVNARDAITNGGSIVIETTNVVLDEGYAKNHVSAKPGSYVLIAVSDTGTGMDEETRRHIFEPFFTTKEVGKGTGLGLSTVYGIVKQSDGNIWVYSEVGRGTTFKIYLPRVVDEAAAFIAKPASTDFKFGSETILLVEDEEVVRNLSREVLESCGYRVIEAGDGMDALEICNDPDLRIDLLMTDIVMPQIGGRELAQQLGEKYPGLRVLFVSGYTDSAAIRHGILDKGTNFLPKPFTYNDLVEKVRELLDRPGK